MADRVAVLGAGQMGNGIAHVFAQSGFRPVDPSATQASGVTFATVTDLWNITYLGGWKTAVPQYFGTNGIYTQAIAAAQGQ